MLRCSVIGCLNQGIAQLCRQSRWGKGSAMLVGSHAGSVLVVVVMQTVIQG